MSHVLVIRATCGVGPHRQLRVLLSIATKAGLLFGHESSASPSCDLFEHEPWISHLRDLSLERDSCATFLCDL